MIFNTTSGAGKKLPVLNAGFPANVTVNAGTDAVFRVVVSEEGMPSAYSYQWYVNESPVSGATQAEYTRDTASDAGVYSVFCVLTNKAGSAISRTAALTVRKTPTLNASCPVDAAVTVGSSVTCQVSLAAAGYPDSYTYQWYKNGSAVSGATGASCTFTPTAAGTDTVYCKVTNAAGTVTSRTAAVTADYCYLFQNGGLGVSGGYTFNPSSCGSLDSDSICLNCVSGYAYANNPVDLTNFTKMTVQYITDGYAPLTAGFVTASGSTSFAASVRGVASSQTTMTLDLSSLAGSYYLALYKEPVGDYAHVNHTYQIYLE